MKAADSNGMMAYTCNYAIHAWSTLPNVCELREMEAKWEEMKRNRNNPTGHGLGWWHEKDWKKTIGSDIWGKKICTNMSQYRQWQFEEVCRGGRCRRIHG